MKKQFIIDKFKDYIIYGAGGGGLKNIRLLKQHGFNVIGVVDKRAHELEEVCGIPTMTIDEVGERVENKENTVIIITPKNVFQHSEIALNLVQVGFKNIIYKPLEVLHGSNDEKLLAISKIHDSFLVKIELPEGEEAYSIDGSANIELQDMLLIGQKTESEVVAWVPIELVFNYKKHAAYYDINMPTLFPVVELYEMLLGKRNMESESCINNYINYASEWLKRNNLELTEGVSKAFLQTRMSVFEEMQRIAEVDRDFFIRNASSVIAEKGIHFTINSSGKNRVSYLIARGYRYVPFIMDVALYDRWINKEVLNEIETIIRKNNIHKLFTCVAHPKLVSMPVEVVDYVRVFCCAVGRQLIKELYATHMETIGTITVVKSEEMFKVRDNTTAACMINDNGTITRYLASLGFKVYRCANTNVTDIDKKLENKLDELLYAEMDKIQCLELDEFEKADVGIIDNRCDQREIKEFLNKIGQVVYVLSWEDKNELGSMLQAAQFEYESGLFTTYWNGKRVQGSIYRKRMMRV